MAVLGRINGRVFAGVVLLVVLFAAGLALRPREVPGPCSLVHAATLPDIPEASGLAISRRTPGVIWAHNDSGHDAVLYALDASGTLLGRVRVPVRTQDWEDISAARCPSGDCLYIADIGDNAFARRRLQIYRVPEPSTDDMQTARPEVFSAAYADGAHNAEAAFVIDDALFVITRDRRGGLYRSTLPSGDRGEVTLERIGELGLEVVTDAEASLDAALIVVRTSHEAVFYRTADLSRGAVIPTLRVPLDGLREPQGEGVALGANGVLYLASEGRLWNRGGMIVGLRCTLPQ